MGFTVEAPEEKDMLGGASFLAAPGTYHLQVTDVDEQPTNKEGGAVDGFQVEFTVLAGPEAGKKLDLTFFNPKSSSKDGGLWARKKQVAFLLASGLMTEAQLGKQVTVELSEAVNRQVVAELELGQEGRNGKRFLELAWANIYHVDDPRGSKATRDAKALGKLPKSQRRDAASFKGAGATSGGDAPAVNSQPAADDDLGDL